MAVTETCGFGSHEYNMEMKIYTTSQRERNVGSLHYEAKRRQNCMEIYESKSRNVTNVSKIRAVVSITVATTEHLKHS